MEDRQKDTLRSMQALIEQMNTRCFLAALEGKFTSDSRERMKRRCQWIIEQIESWPTDA